MNLQAKYTELRKASVGALRVISQLESENAALKAEVEKMTEDRDRWRKIADGAREALEKISNTSQFGRDGGPVVTSEHYEAAWLDCVEIAKNFIAAFPPSEK